MALRFLLSAAAPSRIFNARLQVRRISLIVDSRVIDSFAEEGDEPSTHALALTTDDSNEARYKLVIRRNEPDAIAGFVLPKEAARYGSMQDLVGSKSYRPTRVDNELVNELCRLLKQGDVTAWEAEDLVRSNGGVLMPYHICEVLKNYKDDADLAYAFFQWADLHKGYEHDQFSCNAIIKILGKNRKFQEMKMVLNGMEEQMIPITYVTYRILLRTYVEAFMVEEALETFHKLENCEIQPTLEDYNYFMMKLIKLRCPQIVPMVFGSMRSKRIFPTTLSYNFLISSLCSLGEMSEAYGKLLHMKKFVSPDEYTYAALINGFCKCMDADKTVDLLEEMLSMGLKPDLPLFNMMMECHTRCGKHEMVITLFERMITHECKPDPKTYRVLVDSFAITGRIDEAFDFLQKFSDGEYAPNLGAYNTLMNRLGRANKAQAALEVFQKIKDKPSYKPDLVTYNIVLDLLGKVGRINDAWSCYVKMKSLRLPDAFTYNTIIVRLGKAGMFEQCLTVFEDMTGDGCVPDHITYAGLIECCARNGKVDLAMKYLQQMKIHRLYLNPGTVDMLVNIFLKAGRFDAAELLVEQLGPSAKTATKRISGATSASGVMEMRQGYLDQAAFIRS